MDVARSSETRVALSIQIGRFLFRYRTFVFPAVLIALTLGIRPVIAFGRGGLDVVVDALGVAVVLGGQLLRLLVIGFAYIKRAGRNKQVFAERLVQEGFFAHSRNPLYFGNWLIVLGLLVIHGSWVALLVGLLFFTAAYWTIVVTEEQYLAQRFGPVYLEYSRRVNRFVPSFAGLRASLRGMRFDWKRALRKEYGTLFANVTAVLGLLLWERHARPAGLTFDALARTVLGLWIACLAGYGLARTLKKSHRLGTS